MPWNPASRRACGQGVLPSRTSASTTGSARLARYIAPGACAAVCALALSPCARAGQSASRQDLFRAYKSAVVGIEVSYAGIRIAAGSGFFISEQGELAARYSLLADALLRDDMTVTFRPADGAALREYKIAGCGGRRGLDLCLLKLRHRPKAWFPKHKSAPFKGERAFLLGRGGRGQSFSDGMVTELREDHGVGGLEVSNSVEAAEYGAAVLNEEGALLGMVAGAASNGCRVLPAAEIYGYALQEHSYRDAEQFRRMFQERRRLAGEELVKGFIEPARQAMENGEEIAKLLRVKLDFRSPKASYRGFLPDVGWRCAKAPGGLSHTLCVQTDPVFGTLARFGVRVSDWKQKKDLIAFESGRKAPPEPGDLVKALQQKGRWKADAALLDDRQRKALFSAPEAAQCDLSFSGVFKGRPSCSRLTRNQDAPEASSYSLSFVDKGVLLEFYSWSRDPGLSPFYLKLPGLFASTLLEVSVARAPRTKPRFDDDWLKLKP